MLANTLSKKYLAEETSAPGVVQRHRSSDSKASSSPQEQITVTTDSSSAVTTPIVISVPDDDDDDDLMEEAHLQVSFTTNSIIVLTKEGNAGNGNAVLSVVRKKLASNRNRISFPLLNLKSK